MLTHDEEEQNAIDFVQSKNKCRLYQATKKEVENNKLQARPKPEPTLSELKASHDNHFINSENSMLKKELNKLKKRLEDKNG